VETSRRTLELSFATWEEMLQALAGFPTQVAAKEALSEEEFGAYQDELLGLIDRFNEASDGSVLVPCHYLVIVARKRG
jgi:hypothetical protein